METDHEDHIGGPLIAKPGDGVACIRFRSNASRPAASRLAGILREHHQDAALVLDPAVGDVEGDEEGDDPVSLLLVQVPHLPDLQVEARIVEDPDLEDEVGELVADHLDRQQVN